MKWKFWQKDTENYKQKNTRLVVTGVCKESDKEQLQKDLKNSGVTTVVTSVPVLGTFDL